MLSKVLSYTWMKDKKEKIMKEKTKVLFVRIPETWLNKINRIAKKECRTQVSVARQAIKEFLSKKKEVSHGTL